MRAFATMFVAAAGYILMIGSLMGMTTISPPPAHVLTAVLGESTVVAVETPPALVAGCEPITMS
ncbi:MAG: hypothetical protein ACREK7_07385 [Gemmatimonadota bacterium]